MRGAGDDGGGERGGEVRDLYAVKPLAGRGGGEEGGGRREQENARFFDLPGASRFAELRDEEIPCCRRVQLASAFGVYLKFEEHAVP